MYVAAPGTPAFTVSKESSLEMELGLGPRIGYLLLCNKRFQNAELKTKNSYDCTQFPRVRNPGVA